MKVYRGKQIIGKHKSAELVVDFNDLFRDRGNKYEKKILEKRIAYFILVLAILLIAVPLLLALMNGELLIKNFLIPAKVLNVVPFIGIPFFLYSLYLVRDRDTFEFNYEKRDLKSVKKDIDEGNIVKVEVDNFFNVTCLEAIDKLYFKYNTKFLIAFADFLLKYPSNSEIIRQRLGIDADAFRSKVIQQLSLESFDSSFDTNYTDFFLRAFSEALEVGAEKIDPVVMLFMFNKFYFVDVYKSFNIMQLELDGLNNWFRNETRKKRYYALWKKLSKLKPKGAVNRAYTSRATPTLDKFSSDFTSIAARGRFVTSLGKEDAMLQILRVLQLTSGSAVFVMGQPGVGKTTFLQHLATKMVVEDVPKVLQDSRLIVVDLGRVLTENSSVDAFKQVLQKMLDEIIASGNIILVFEDFSQILGIRDEGKLEVINLIANMINKYKLKVIATINTDDYSRGIKPNKALSSLFEVVEIKEPPSNIALQILIDQIPEFESKYHIQIQLGGLKRIVELAPKFDYERVMPDKGIDLLEEAVVTANNVGLKVLTKDFVDDFISKKIGVNVGQISTTEAERLKNIETQMHERVVGQDEAIRAVAAALRRSRSGLSSGKRPVASFLFYGPTGVGKTEISKTLAETYYGDEKLMIRVDMSEYQEEENLSRLIGYNDENGNFRGGYLTEAVRTKPFSLVLLDEIEKANPKVLDLFLQVLDEGNLTDGLGRKVDFTNTIIIMTSNAGSRQIADLILKGLTYYDVEKEVSPTLREVFRVEFLNRFDKVIMFKPLTKIEVQQIADLMLKSVEKRLIEKGMDLKWDKITLANLADLGYSSIYGAREMRRIVQEEIEDKIANLIIEMKLLPGGIVAFSGLKNFSITG